MTIWIGIPPERNGIDWDNFNWYYIQRELQGWARASAKQHQHIEVRTTSSRKVMAPEDVLIYLVGDPANSVLGLRGLPMSQDMAAGVTVGVVCHGMLSEVYANVCTKAYSVAATIYHELLHNKLEGDSKYNVHGTDGGNFTARVAPFSEGGPSAADQRLLAVALTKPGRQAQIGFDPIPPQGIKPTCLDPRLRLPEDN